MLIGNRDNFFPEMITDMIIYLSDHPLRCETRLGTLFMSTLKFHLRLEIDNFVENIRCKLRTARSSRVLRVFV